MKPGGYVFIDHRASPGLPEEIARSLGYDPALLGEGKLFESDTLTCSHCKCTVVKNTLRTRERATCLKCSGHYICDYCALQTKSPDYSHLSYEKFKDEILNGKVPLFLTSETGLGAPMALTKEGK